MRSDDPRRSRCDEEEFSRLSCCSLLNVGGDEVHFCNKDSSTSRSVEHIIPESFGNTDHVLPVGVVCDACNQYFARKVERQILESPMFDCFALIWRFRISVDEYLHGFRTTEARDLSTGKWGASWGR